MRGYLRPLRDGRFAALWLAQAVSDFGTQFTRIAVLLLADAVGASGAIIAALFLAQLIPSVTLGPFAGVFVDRWNRKYTMVVVDLLRAAAVFSYVLVHNAFALCALALVASTLGLFFGPARSSYIPEVVRREDLVGALSIGQLTANAALLAGPAVAGVLIAAAGLDIAFVIDAVSFLVSAIVVSCLRLPPLPTAVRRGPGTIAAECREGLTVIWRTLPVRVGLLGISTVFLVGGVVNVLQVNYGLDVLRVGDRGLGMFFSAAGLGAIVSALLLGQFGRRSKKIELSFGGAALLGLTYTLYWLRPAFSVFLAIAFIGNAMSVLISVPLNALLMEHVPAAQRGRVFAAAAAIFNVPSLVAYTLAGALAVVGPPHWAMGAAGALMMVGVLAMRSSPAYKAATRWKAPPGPAEA